MLYYTQFIGLLDIKMYLLINMLLFMNNYSDFTFDNTICCYYFLFFVPRLI